MMSSTEKPGVSKTLENEVDNAVSHQSKSPAGRNRGDDTDKVTWFWKHFFKYSQCWRFREHREV